MQLINLAFPVVQVPIELKAPVYHVQRSGDQTLVVTHPLIDRRVARVDPTAETVVARLNLMGKWLAPKSPDSDDLIVRKDDWWYVSLGGRDSLPGITFIRSDGAGVTHMSPVPGALGSLAYLIVLEGEHPRALELTPDSRSTLARELDWSGELRSWELPERHLLRRMRAVAMPDGTIALFSNRSGLRLYLLGDDGAVDETVVMQSVVNHFDVAINSAGVLAVVAVRNDTEEMLTALLPDLSRASAASWQVVRRGVRGWGNRHVVRVVSDGDVFYSAWVNAARGNRVELTKLSSRPVVDVAQASPWVESPFLGLQADGEHVTVWWDDGDRIFGRRFPNLDGWAFLRALPSAICRAATGRQDPEPEPYGWFPEALR